MKRNTEKLQHEIKEIIYGCAKKSGMCDNFVDGQILGLRTGEGLEFDMVTLGLAQWYCDKVLKILHPLMNDLKKTISTEYNEND